MANKNNTFSYNNYNRHPRFKTKELIPKEVKVAPENAEFEY